MISLTYSLLIHIAVNQSCDAAFEQFKQIFDKNYDTVEREQQAKSIFCERYADLKELVNTSCKECIVTSVYDIPYEQLLNLKQSPPSPLKKLFGFKLSTIDCGNNYCYAINDLKPLTQIPASIDFREVGLATAAKAQKSCGSCWSFGTTAALETAILRDQAFLKESNSKWYYNAINLSLSEQFMMQNSRQFNTYCTGGDSTVALYHLANYFETVELEKNFNYDPIPSNDVSVKPKLSKQDYYIPMQTFAVVQDSKQKTAAINLYLNSSASFDNKTIQMIKSYLARGLPVIAAMYTGAGRPQFSSYAGNTILDAKCSRYSADHQVLITGYGRKNGRDVWIVKNSWGAQWGHYGYFYVAQGTNAFCIEHYAFGVIPKYYDTTTDLPFSERYESAFQQIVRGQDGLDVDLD